MCFFVGLKLLLTRKPWNDKNRPISVSFVYSFEFCITCETDDTVIHQQIDGSRVRVLVNRQSTPVVRHLEVVFVEHQNVVVVILDPQFWGRANWTAKKNPSVWGTIFRIPKLTQVFPDRDGKTGADEGKQSRRHFSHWCCFSRQIKTGFATRDASFVLSATIDEKKFLSPGGRQFSFCEKKWKKKNPNHQCILHMMMFLLQEAFTLREIDKSLSL